MSEYIDREKIMLKTCSDCTRQINLVCKHDEPCEKLIAAFLCEEHEDVAPVVHAKWGEYESFPLAPSMNGYPCSNCGMHFSASCVPILKYCPNCGAKMDLTID